MKPVKYLPVFFLLTIVFSCSKKADEIQPPILASDKNIYVAGNDGAVAKIWTNGVATSLSGGTQALSVFVSGTDVYVVGNQVNLNNSVPILWKNGNPTMLAVTNTNAFNEATAIYVNGTDVYITGGYDDGQRMAVIWKNGVAAALTDGTEDAEAYSIYVNGSDVYAGGYSDYTGGAVIWKNGIVTGLTDGKNAANIASVFISGTDVFAAGYEASGNSAGTAKVWKNGSPVTLGDSTIGTDGVIDNSFANAVYVSGTDVYVVGSQNNNNGIGTAVVWKNGLSMALTDGNNDAAAYSVFVSGTDVYVTGYESNGTNNVAKIWKNGVATALTDGSSNASGQSIFIK